jgi:hypothetical protein
MVLFFKHTEEFGFCREEACVGTLLLQGEIGETLVWNNHCTEWFEISKMSDELTVKLKGLSDPPSSVLQHLQSLHIWVLYKRRA